jgi:uncharacterized protein with HEPN domain
MSKEPKEFLRHINDECLYIISIQWKNMAGMRDRLIHDYMGINYAIVWDVIQNKVPDMNKQISKLLSE